MELAVKSGWMVPNMKVTGRMDRLKVLECLLIPIKMFTVASFIKTEPTDMEFIYIKTARNMKGIGKMMYRKDREKKFLRMDLFTKACLKMGRNGDLELISGQINRGIRGTG